MSKKLLVLPLVLAACSASVPTPSPTATPITPQRSAVVTAMPIATPKPTHPLVGSPRLMPAPTTLPAPSSPATIAPLTASLPPTNCPAGVPLTSGSIATIAGGGSALLDGSQATDASIDVTVGGLAVDDTGAIYVSGYYDTRLRKVGADGVISTIAAPSRGAPFQRAAWLAFDAAGDLYLGDPDTARLWRIDRTGKVSPIAGTGVTGSTGDDGPALDAKISAGPVTAGPMGSLYLGDNDRYRVIGPDGTIHAFAGTGTPGFSGDGGPAVKAMFGGTDKSDESYAEVFGVATDAAGNVYLSDTGNQRIRRVDRNGIITTVAGTGERGYSGDGGPALAATFQDPVDLALDAAGNLYISDHHNFVVRRVDTSGFISTVAGNFPAATHAPGDCGPATAAYLQPWAIAVHDGYLYIGDMANQRIRVVKL